MSSDIVKQHWIEEALGRLHADRALFALADMRVSDWCDGLGGLPKDSGELLALRCALEPTAAKLLSSLMAMPDQDRRALSHKLWPARKDPADIAARLSAERTAGWNEAKEAAALAAEHCKVEGSHWRRDIAAAIRALTPGGK